MATFTRSTRRILLTLAGPFMLGACSDIRERAEQLFDRRPARERYLDALEKAGLGSRALVRDWVAAADRALREPAIVTAPHAEQGYVAASDVVALGFRVTARRGQEVTFEMAIPGDTTT